MKDNGLTHHNIRIQNQSTVACQAASVVYVKTTWSTITHEVYNIHAQHNTLTNGFLQLWTWKLYLLNRRCSHSNLLVKKLHLYFLSCSNVACKTVACFIAGVLAGQQFASWPPSHESWDLSLDSGRKFSMTQVHISSLGAATPHLFTQKKEWKIEGKGWD